MIAGAFRVGGKRSPALAGEPFNGAKIIRQPVVLPWLLNRSAGHRRRRWGLLIDRVSASGAGESFVGNRI